MSANDRDSNKVSAPSRPDFVRGMVAGHQNGHKSKSEGSMLLALAAGFLFGKAIRRGRK